jgi:anti-sigma B factor antagonist
MSIPVGRQPVRVAETRSGQEVTVSGRLDVTSVDEVRLAIHAILDRGVDDLLVHLAQAEVHDAAGLGVIVGIHHRARRMGRRLVLVDVSPRLDRLLRASRLHRVLARGPGPDVVARRTLSFAEMPVDETMVTEAEMSGARTVEPAVEAVQPPAETVPPLTD